MDVQSIKLYVRFNVSFYDLRKRDYIHFVSSFANFSRLLWLSHDTPTHTGPKLVKSVALAAIMDSVCFGAVTPPRH